MYSRKYKLALNTISSLAFQVTTIVCGFILPRIILAVYGSEINGLVNSITQFLGIVSFMELGIGAVVQSSLYKPLADQDFDQISRIYVSASKFFKTIARVLIVYVIFLVIVYPYFSKQQFSWSYNALLIIAISISMFAQYYFGIVNQLLLNADQHGYIQYNIQTITLLLNTVVSAIFIYLGASIQVVKFTTSAIYIFRPIILELYVRKHYQINKKITYDTEPIQQKWNGIAQHVAYVILQGTDNIVLTLFSTLSNVSIYSVYNLVVYGIKQLIISTTGGFQALLGDLWARQEKKELNSTFGWFEWLVHTGTVYLFGCTGVLIVPFVAVYTHGISDANYIQPLFAVLITAANAGHCLRLPYNLMIFAGGHYKQTQSNYIISAIMNIAISIAMVSKFGLVGVAIGTLVSMMYQTIWMAWYTSRHLIKWPFYKYCKQIAVDFLSIITICLLTNKLKISNISYLSWISLSIKVMLIAAFVVIAINYIFYKDKVVLLFNRICSRMRRK